jgi:conjugation system TraG family ATPase
MTTILKNRFSLPFTGLQDGILYGQGGDMSFVFGISNLAVQHGADAEYYDNYHFLLVDLIKLLGEGYIIQKHDIIDSRHYHPAIAEEEFLERKYHEHFQGRMYNHIQTYLTITRQVKKGRFYVYDKKIFDDFIRQREKILQFLKNGGLAPHLLAEAEIQRFVNRLLAVDFSENSPVLNNMLCRDNQLGLGDKVVRSLSLVSTDDIQLPGKVATYTFRQNDSGMHQFPVDNLSFLFSVPDHQCIIYHQALEIPAQQHTLHKLQLKRKRHSGVPDAANNLCVEDIDLLLIDVARDGQLLVNVHYNILICTNPEHIDKASNFVEAALFRQGIIPSRNAYNQLELFRASLPGNAVELKNYDWLLTTSDAAICFFFKERLPADEPSDFLIRFTDRQGVPIAIDPADLPMQCGRISNRSKFCLGASGTGKSFFMAALLQQYMRYNMDVVIVDTGHSYSGLCSYYQGKYITWADHSPITMNPFALSQSEFNIEKIDFLCTLVSLLWKGTEEVLTNVEHDVIAQVIREYYEEHFVKTTESKNAVLSFNTFYEFALRRIPGIQKQDDILFDLVEFRYVLKKFYKGGQYQMILNQKVDESLFTERFIVFEIDNIKQNKVLFPIVTLIIMDVFLQKMRYRQDRRKALVIEEAWKAISSPLMADYLLYLYKTVRKFWGEAIVVTQELGDILGNAVVKDSILANSDTVCLLDQRKFKDNYSDIAKLLSLSVVEQQKIFTINQLDNKQGRGRFKEVYIKRGNQGEVYGVEVSMYQYLAFTTEKPEKLAVERYVQRFGNYQKGLEAFVTEMQKSKLGLSAFVQQVNQL